MGHGAPERLWGGYEPWGCWSWGGGLVGMKPAGVIMLLWNTSPPISSLPRPNFHWDIRHCQLYTL